MPNPSSPVSSGNISPAIVGPSKDTKEVYLIGGLVMAVAIVTGGFWYYSGQDQPYPSKTQSEPLNFPHSYFKSLALLHRHPGCSST